MPRDNTDGLQAILLVLLLLASFISLGCISNQPNFPAPRLNLTYPNQSNISSNDSAAPVSLPCVGLNCSGRYDFVIITRPLFVNKSIEYLIWKESKGFKTKLVTLDDIVTRYPGIHTTDRIKSYIHSEHNSGGAMYFLLVGDALAGNQASGTNDLTNTDRSNDDISAPWAIPVPCTIDAFWNDQYGRDRSIGNCVDFFYADANDWDPDRNGRYEDNSITSSDYNTPIFRFPLYVSRISVRSPNELDNIFAKQKNLTLARSVYVALGDDAFNPSMYDMSDPVAVLEMDPCFTYFAVSRALEDTLIASESDLVPRDRPDNVSLIQKLFQTDTVVAEHFHGSIACIHPPIMEPICEYSGSVVSPLFLSGSCYVDAFFLGDEDTFFEKLEKGKGGPAILMSAPRDTQVIAFLANGSTSGEAFYRALSLATFHTVGGTRAFFGDPSLKIFAEPGYLPVDKLANTPYSSPNCRR